MPINCPFCGSLPIHPHKEGCPNSNQRVPQRTLEQGADDVFRERLVADRSRRPTPSGVISSALARRNLAVIRARFETPAAIHAATLLGALTDEELLTFIDDLVNQSAI